MSADTLLVLTTCGGPEDGKRLARLLVEERLAACVNAVSNVISTYRWKDQIHQDQETLLVIKTTRACFEAVEQAIREHSSYELPEVVAVAIEAGSAPYLSWLRESVTRS